MDWINCKGRLKYSTGDTAGAVRQFSGLLRSPNAADNILESDKMFLEDFRAACQHLVSTKADDRSLDDLDIPLCFCQATQTRLRLGVEPRDDLAEWEGVEDYWNKFLKLRGDHAHLDTRQSAQVGEPFWVDLSLINPIEADVTLTDFTVIAESLVNGLPIAEIVTIETIGTVSLRPKEHAMVSIRVTPHLQTTIKFTHASYTFLSLVPTSESLAFQASASTIQQPNAEAKSTLRMPFWKCRSEND
ncbi:hypothetical protein BS47DRAFT_419921 [Hydnum rufescens UP504]|uniref:Uncharacterized protein n=1 Tax=Hydnum rufescens UP504 TaxID=1448309 RepID=A0A9P6B800_9AGAM|nr:hypothetical protein BS47DRAFT_419921 [Hydnum rufescens UP504]